MGKLTRWLCNLLTFKKPQHHHLSTDSNKHRNHHTSRQQLDDIINDPDKHAIAEAAIVASKAAAAVVKLTSSRRCESSYFRERWGAVVIQSAFRGYLARKALKALKALVRLQALVRGHIARKQTAAQVRQMQALLRVQARARAGRVLISESSQSSTKSANYHHPGPATPEKLEEIRSRSPRRNQPSSLKKNTSKSESRRTTDQVRPHRRSNWDSRSLDDRVWDPLMRNGPVDDVNSDKILGVDPGKPYSTSNRENYQFHSSHHIMASDFRSHSLTTSKDSTTHQAPTSSYSCEAISVRTKDYSCELEDASYCTAENSPRFYSASSIGYGSSRRVPFTPTESVSLRSYLSGYSDHPNYMSNTESSKAKLRSMSAPKQRLQYERSSSTKRHAQRLSALHASFANKACPGSGRLDNLGMPVTGGDSYTSF